MMKSVKKAIIAAVCAGALVVGSVAGTMAYLTDKTDDVTNTFTLGKVDIDLTETQGTTADSTKPNEKGYKMVPGNPIEKDPKVTVEMGSEDCWLFVKVNAAAKLGEFIDYQVLDGWTKLTDVEGDVYYRSVEADSTKDQVFNVIGYVTGKDAEGNPVISENQVFVKESVTKEQMENDGKDLTLTFTAYAVQKSGFDDVEKSDADNAKAAWNKINEKTSGSNESENENA